MEAKDYEAIGRIYCEIVALQEAAAKNDLYIGGGMDKDGDFYLTVYDKNIDERYYGTSIFAVCDGKIEAIRAEINTVKGFIAGWAKAREIAEKAAKQPEVEFGPLEEVKPKEQEAA